MGVSVRGVKWTSVTSYRSHYKTLRVCYSVYCYGFAAEFFDYPKFGGRNAPRGSTMIPLSRELVSSHRLSIQITLVSGPGTVWPKFAMQVFTGVANPQFGGRSGRMGSEMGPLSSPVRLPIGSP